MGWKTVMKQQKLVEKMTIEEKAAILSGKTVWQTREIDRLSIPSIFLSDGPHGIRKQAGAGDHLGLNASLNATCFPTAATIANSWNQDLGEEIGQALGEEAASMDVNILLGPGLNIKRSPLCGRNFEYFSEDPYLSGKMAASYIRGIQSKGVYACPKHLAVNSQELRRMAMDAVVDERTLREIYLTGFEIAVKEGHAKAIMSSYNQINGIYANEDKHLLTDILRKDWGFSGIVMTDWWAKANHEGQLSDPRIHAVMAAAQNDVYMVTADAQDMPQDDMLEEFQKGNLTRGQLQRNAINILQFVLKSPAMLYEMNRISPEELKDRKNAAKDDPDVSKMMKFVADEQENIRISGDGWDTHQGKEILADLDMKAGSYELQMKVKSNLDDLAQLPVTVYLDNIIKGTLSFRGSKGQWVTQQIRFDTFEGHHYMKLYFGATGLTVDHIAFQMSGGADKEQ